MKRVLRIGLSSLLAACADELEEHAAHRAPPRQPGLAVETHAVVEGSRDPLVARVGSLLRVRCLAFDAEGLVTSSLGIAPTLRRGIGLAKVRREGWLELYEPGRIEVVCDHPAATVQRTVVMVEPLLLPEVASAHPDAR